MFSIAYQLEYLEFAIRENRHRRAGAFTRREVAQYILAKLRTDINTAAQNLPDRPEQCLRPGFLHDVAMRSSVEHTLGVELLVMHREHQHACFGMQCMYILDE